MRWPKVLYQIQEAIAKSLPTLRPAQQRGLAVWVYGTLLAGNACQNAVLTALTGLGHWESLRQGLREWLYDGADRAAPCQTQVDVTACFGGLLGWVLRLWGAGPLWLAVDATTHHEKLVALVVRVLYPGSAIPVAWHIRLGNAPGEWMEPILALLDKLQAAMPSGQQVWVLSDRGLWSPRLFKKLVGWGWHPLMRGQSDLYVTPQGQGLTLARLLVSGAGHAWVGRAVAYKQRRLPVSLLVWWAEDHAEPVVVLTDVPPRRCPSPAMGSGCGSS